MLCVLVFVHFYDDEDNSACSQSQKETTRKREQTLINKYRIKIRMRTLNVCYHGSDSSLVTFSCTYSNPKT